MMDELKQIKAAVKPDDILLVVDAMTGQEAAGEPLAWALIHAPTPLLPRSLTLSLTHSLSLNHLLTHSFTH